MKKFTKKLLLFLMAVSLYFSQIGYATTTETVPVATGDENTTTINNEQAASDAKTYFKNLSSKERKLKMKEAKQAVKDYKKEKKAGSKKETDQLLLILIAILIPPLAVYLHEDEINGKFWLDLILTLLFYIPGLIYALIVIL